MVTPPPEDWSRGIPWAGTPLPQPPGTMALRCGAQAVFPSGPALCRTTACWLQRKSGTMELYELKDSTFCRVLGRSL